jgi:hypothetical protein
MGSASYVRDHVIIRSEVGYVQKNYKSNANHVTFLGNRHM